MNAGDTRYLCVSWVCSADVRAAGRYHSPRVVFLEKKIVIAFWIFTKLRVVMKWAQCQRRTAPPPAHHLRSGKLLVSRAIRVRLYIFSKFRDTLMEFAKDDIRTVLSEDLRFGFLKSVLFIPVADDEFTRLDRSFFRVTARNAAALDRRMTDAVLITERLFVVRQCMAILPPDRFDPGHA